MTKHLLFDFDGTLMDSSAGIIRSMKYALAKTRFKEAAEADTIRRAIGLPLVPMIQKITGAGSKEAGKIAKEYRKHYAKKGLFMARPYKNIRQVLSRLSSSHTLFIVSTKPGVFLKRLLKKKNMEKYFAGVYGPGLGYKPTRKAELIRRLVGDNRIKNTSCVMIGDKAEDILAAKENSITGIGVAYGYGTRRELKKAGAISIISSPDRLIRQVTSI